MSSANVISETVGNKLARQRKFLLALILILPFLAGTAWGQVTASITGTAKDSSGAAIAGATITVKNIDTDVTRTVQTDADGNYQVSSLQVGQYQLRGEKPGFKLEVRSGITLVVAQQAVVNLTLEVGNIEQQVTVTGEAPLVNTTPSSTSGLVNEEQVKDLPLNGRSFDQLLTLNAGTNNYSSHTVNNGFSVVGRRPEENRFLVNGVDYFSMIANGNTDTPYGASKELLGVDAVREFNVVQHTYGAEYGKRARGQVAIVSSSGTNQLHGTVFEFVRNSMFDARNFFDHPLDERIPPFRRNQFGGALGGPLKKDKMFLFGNYEGFRQRLGISDQAVVPDINARNGKLIASAGATPTAAPGLVQAMLAYVDNFWPVQNGPELNNGVGGQAIDYANPVQSIREDFGLVQYDYDISTKDTFTTNYLIDSGVNDLPQGDPFFISIAPIRSQVLSLHETHIFSPALLNVATFGFSRSAVASATLPLGVTIPASLSFITGLPPGTITVGGGGAGSGASGLAVAGGFQSVPNVKNLFTAADDVHYIRGKHSFSAGAWFQRIQVNAGGSTANKAGAVTFPSVAALLSDAPTQFVAYQNFTELYFRSIFGAWYVQDEIKVRPNLTVRLGLRMESTNGWNEAQGHCTNYEFTNGIINTNPTVGNSCLEENNSTAMFQPRIGISWDPTGSGKWAVRVGAGIYRDLQDGMNGRIAANPPFNAQITSTAPLLNVIPLAIGTPPPSCSVTQPQPCSIFSPGGIDPDMHTPTIQEWSFTVERQLMANLALQIGYVGSQSYHLEDSVDSNEATPLVCQLAAGCASGGINKATGVAPEGDLYLPPGTRPNPFVAQSFSWFYGGVSSYNALNASLIKRASRGLIFKVNYTYSKIIDLNSTPDPSAGNNQPSHLVSYQVLSLSRGVAAYNLRHQFNFNYSYQLPFGQGQQFGGNAHGVYNQLIGGWQWNGIFTAQSGFPFTPLAGQNISGTGDTGNPDQVNYNTAFTGPVILGGVAQWFNPKAFTLPISGTFGDVARGSFLGPDLIEFDTSLFKKFPVTERVNLEFRTEFFNIANRANFGSPSPLVFSGANINPSAGLISATATTSRQIQFALKLMF